MTWWQGLIIGMAIGFPAGAAWVLWRFLQLHAQMDSADMAMTIRALQDKVRKQAGFILGWQFIAAGVLAAVVAGYVVVTQIKLANCRAENAEFKRAFDVLSVQVQTQAVAMSELERRAKEAAQRGAQARSEAQPVVEAAQKSADALAGAMRGVRPAECPTKDAVRVVREDLGR